jgi:hypothetical protein
MEQISSRKSKLARCHAFGSALLDHTDEIGNVAGSHHRISLRLSLGRRSSGNVAYFHDRIFWLLIGVVNNGF